MLSRIPARPSPPGATPPPGSVPPDPDGSPPKIDPRSVRFGTDQSVGTDRLVGMDRSIGMVGTAQTEPVQVGGTDQSKVFQYEPTGLFRVRVRSDFLEVYRRAVGWDRSDQGSGTVPEGTKRTQPRPAH
jgi:hypothetical protein